jgi:glycosyltransferase involved in cell wall biosynthesis
MSSVMLLATAMEGGGAEAQMAQLAIELARRGWRVAVVSLLPAPTAEKRLAAQGITALSLGMRPGLADPRGMLRLLLFLQRFQPAIVHSHLFHANLLARAVRLLWPAPVVISTLHSIAESGRALEGTRWRDLAYRITGCLADRTVAVSQAVGNRHVEARAVSRRKLLVIPNGVDVTAFRPDPELRARRRRELGFGNEFVWLAAGRLMWKKDYPTLLRAFASLGSGELLIAGEGPQEPELRTLAGELRISPRFLGRAPDMPALLNAADALALSSKVEGLPMVLLEAAACGLPAVAADAGGVREALIENETGFVCPPGDAHSLHAAMARLAGASAEQRATMGAAARRLAVERFDLNGAVTEWERLYRELLAAEL